MSRLWNTAVVMGALLIGGVALAQSPLLVAPSVTWHQRLTLTVETPEGEVSASSVTAVTARDNTRLIYALPEAATFQSEFTGKAVALEVAPGRWLFARLHAAGGGWAWAAYDLGVREGPSASFRLLADLPLNAPAPMPRDAYPILITFDDIADPTSVREVDADDLSATFGEGVQLGAVTLAITEEAVTRGQMEQVLGVEFFRQRVIVRRDAFANGGFDHPYFSTLSATLTRNNFIEDRVR